MTKREAGRVMYRYLESHPRCELQDTAWGDHQRLEWETDYNEEIQKELEDLVLGEYRVELNQWYPLGANRFESSPLGNCYREELWPCHRLIRQGPLVRKRRGY